MGALKKKKLKNKTKKRYEGEGMGGKRQIQEVQISILGK